MRTAAALLFAVAVAACGGDLNVGDTCTASDGCDDGLTCDTTVGGGYCTRDCTEPGQVAECPDGAVCDELAGQAMRCVRRCEVQSDCRPDLSCNGITGSTFKACKPK